VSNATNILVLVHNNNVNAQIVAADFCKKLVQANIELCGPPTDIELLKEHNLDIKVFTDSIKPNLCLVFGGDGSILRAVEITRDKNIPVLGINLGHVGFLAEAEVEHLDDVIKSIIEKSWSEDERLTLDFKVLKDNNIVFESFALNDVSIEKDIPGHMFDVILEIDSQPVSRLWGDGIICATPTGSTAYAFSAGGPVIWPSVEAMVVVPISAHALFAKPLVVSPDAKIAFEIPADGSKGHLTADGRRSFDLSPGMRIEIKQSASRIRLARLDNTSFTKRLVNKFELPVDGWRGKNRNK